MLKIVTFEEYSQNVDLPKTNDITGQKLSIEKDIAYATEMIDNVCGGISFRYNKIKDSEDENDQRDIQKLKTAIIQWARYVSISGGLWIDLNQSISSQVSSSFSSSASLNEMETNRQDILRMLQAGGWYTSLRTSQAFETLYNTNAQLEKWDEQKMSYLNSIFLRRDGTNNFDGNKEAGLNLQSNPIIQCGDIISDYTGNAGELRKISGFKLIGSEFDGVAEKAKTILDDKNGGYKNINDFTIDYWDGLTASQINELNQNTKTELNAKITENTNEIATHTTNIQTINNNVYANSTSIETLKQQVAALNENQKDDISFVGEITIDKSYNKGDYGFSGKVWYIALKDGINGDTTITENWKETASKIDIDLSNYYTKTEALTLLEPLKTTIVQIENKDKVQDAEVAKIKTASEKNASDIVELQNKEIKNSITFYKGQAIFFRTKIQADDFIEKYGLTLNSDVSVETRQYPIGFGEDNNVETKMLSQSQLPKLTGKFFTRWEAMPSWTKPSGLFNEQNQGNQDNGSLNINGPNNHYKQVNFNLNPNAQTENISSYIKLYIVYFLKDFATPDKIINGMVATLNIAEGESKMFKTKTMADKFINKWGLIEGEDFEITTQKYPIGVGDNGNLIEHKLSQSQLPKLQGSFRMVDRWCVGKDWFLKNPATSGLFSHKKVNAPVFDIKGENGASSQYYDMLFQLNPNNQTNNISSYIERYEVVFLKDIFKVKGE